VPDILVSGKDGGGNGMIDALIGSEMLKKLQRSNEGFDGDAGEEKPGKGEKTAEN